MAAKPVVRTQVALHGGMMNKSSWIQILGAAALASACGGDDGGGTIDAAKTVDGAHGSDAGSGSAAARRFVYVESNGSAANSILAFEEGSDGALTAVGAPVATGGTGITAGSNQRLGPLDSDQQLVASADGNTLFAVNSGDHTVASFAIAADGTLAATSGSPFAIGGENPASLALVGSTLFVLDKEVANTTSPHITAATVSGGTLTPISGGGAALQPGGSPTIAYPSPDGKLLFSTEFLDLSRPTSLPLKQIDAFVVGANGTLTAAPGSPRALAPDDTGVTPAVPPVALNLAAHPTQKILYVAYVTRSELGVYSYDDTGALTFLRTVPNSGAAVCWFAVDPSGQYLWTVNSGSATVSTYSLSDPTTPVETSHLLLSATASGTSFVDAMGKTQTLTSLPFELTLSADGKHLYVISQRVTTVPTDLTGNLLHTLTIDPATGALSEPSAAIDLTAAGVPATARPQGFAVVTK